MGNLEYQVIQRMVEVDMDAFIRVELVDPSDPVTTSHRGSGWVVIAAYPLRAYDNRNALAKANAEAYAASRRLALMQLGYSV
jgi:hypothetical protein